MLTGPSNTMRKRMFVMMAGLVLLGFIGLIGRLFYLQVVANDDLQKKATNQQLRTTEISPKRGTIYDRNMNILAKSATVWTVFVSPADIEDDKEKELIASGLSEILEVDKQDLLDKMKNNTYYEIVKKKIEKDVADKVVEFVTEKNITAVHLVEDNKRYYPNNNLASTVIGFTGTDNQGLAGIEAYYDKILTGTAGKIVSAKNAWGTDMPFKYEQMYDAKDGNSLVLTIDNVIQYFLENNLEMAVEEYGVENRAAAIAIDVNTGEILGMATKPDFNLNEPFEISDPAIKEELEKLTGEAYSKELRKQQEAQWRNKCISDPYEPGSVFKIITASSALEEGTDTKDSQFFCNGSLTVAGRNISCWKHAGHGAEDFTHALMNSCNPAFMAIGAKLGPENYFKYFKAYGLTELTGIDLPGEAESIYHPLSDLQGPVELAVSSFGQTFKVTPIQLITAVSAAINGGKLVQPHIVKQVVDADGNVVKDYSTTVKREVISEEVSNEIALMLEKVVTEGSGRNAYIAGYRIGGKTGTSEKIDQQVNGQVVDFISSFMGFAPADDPQIAVLVLLDEPTKASTFGSVIAAPVVGSVLSETLSYMGIEPQYTAEELEKMDISVPNVVGRKRLEGQNDLNLLGLQCRIVGNGETILEQIPSGGDSIPRGGTVIIYTEESSSSKVTVPDVVGKSGQEANQEIINAGLNIRIAGSGIDSGPSTAAKQEPAAGEEVDEGTVVTVTFVTEEPVDQLPVTQ
ncbi:penicillin-binding transpeptidase domain-containing protein [Candidatus Soleaferrea massiliensis]|uniref:penicillin-binding transpeptidase domain-containing protein n=1 Tax=Candidatus Soleaferrea massiliensis TaxID=1470354 RepID=UPI00058C1AC9|nr:penicillin-binding transpeptidase domain-containing protein [Candidatus Soleaferrea massiliensis]